MVHDVSSPTHLMLSRVNEFYYSAGNVFVPLGKCSNKLLADTLMGFPANEIIVECNPHGTPDQVAADVKTFTRRLRKLPPWFSFSGFQPKVINGHVQTTFAGRLTRSV